MNDKNEKEEVKRGFDIFTLTANAICLGATLYARFVLCAALPAVLPGARREMTDAATTVQMIVLKVMVLVLIFTLSALSQLFKIRKKFLKNLKARLIGIASILVGCVTMWLAFQTYFLV